MVYSVQWQQLRNTTKEGGEADASWETVTASLLQDIRDTLHESLACRNTIEIPQTLREIRDELRQLNKRMKPGTRKRKGTRKR